MENEEIKRELAAIKIEVKKFLDETKLQIEHTGRVLFNKISEIEKKLKDDRRDPPVDPPKDPPRTGRPGEDLDWGVKPAPTRYHWVIENGVATSQNGLGEFNLSEKGCGDLYRMARAAGLEKPIVFGVHDDAGSANLGGLYGLNGPSDLTYNGEAVSATFVGLTDHAEVNLAFATSYSHRDPTGDVGAYNIGLRGKSDSFVIRANGGYDSLIMDGCWYLANPGQETYASGIHTDGWKKLVIRNHKWRGKTPGEPGIKFREHALAYLKSGSESTLIENCDLFGGNRTGFQIRPEVENQPLPTARVMIRGNVSHNYGTNWTGPGSSDGGAAITCWISTNGLYIYDNVVTNFRYKALSVGGQPAQKNFQFLDSGNQHKDVYVSGNTFTPGPATERRTCGFSACDYVRVYDDNQIKGPLVLDTGTNKIYNGLSNVFEEFYTSDGRLIYEMELLDKPMSEQEYRSLMVRYPGDSNPPRR